MTRFLPRRDAPLDSVVMFVVDAHRVPEEGLSVEPTDAKQYLCCVDVCKLQLLKKKAIGSWQPVARPRPAPACPGPRLPEPEPERARNAYC